MPVKTVTIQVTALTDRANADIRATGVYFDQLRAKNPVELKVKLDSAQAIAESKILAKEMAQTVRDTVKLETDKAGGGGLIGKLITGGGGISGPGGIASLVTGPGAAGGAAGIAGLGLGGSLAAAAAAIAAIETGLLGIIPAIASAGLAVGSFGALAIPTFTTVTGAVTQIATDTAAYDAATTKAAKNTALAKIKADWAALTPGQASAVRGIQGLQAAFDKLAAKLAPDVLKIFNQGLAIANKLLPDLLPFAQAAAGAISQLLNGFAKFSSSPGFKDFQAQMLKLSGPAIVAIGEGLGKITIAVGKLLIAMTNPNAIKILTILLDGVAGAIDLVAAAFAYATPRIINNFHDIAATFDFVRRSFAMDGHDIAVTYDAVRTASDITTTHTRAVWVATGNTMASVAAGIEHTFMRWNAVLAGYINDVIGFFRTLPGRTIQALGGWGNSLNGVGKEVINLLWEGLKAGATGILSWIQGFAKGVVGIFKTVWGWFSPSSVMYEGGKSLMEGLAKGIQDHAHKAKAAAAAAASHVVPNVGSGVARWTGVVQQALRMEGLSEGLTRQVLYQIGTESGGNPNAINLTDINAQMGDPSRGLLQTIMATFQAYHWPGTSGNIYDPLANVAAAINYARHVYGPSLMANGSGLGSGHGYAFGGLITEPVFGLGASGQSYQFAEHGPEWVGPARAGGGGHGPQIVALLDELCNLVSANNDLTAAAPARTGAGLGAALASGARAATYKALYS